MLEKVKQRIFKSRALLVLPVALSVFAIAGATASASIGPITYNSTKVTFNLPTQPDSIWQLTLWHDGTMEGRETGTQGQQLNIWVPNVDGCNFQIDARNLTLTPNVITYSARPVIPNCGQTN